MTTNLSALTQRTPHSFTTADPTTIATWLRTAGFRDLTVRSAYELARLQLGGELVIVYHSGSLVCQGAAADRAVQRLATCEVA